MFFLSEDFGSKSLDDRARAPGIKRQSGFAAGLLEKSYAVPGVFQRNLGQQQSPPSMLADEQTVASDFHLFSGNGLRTRENAQFGLSRWGASSAVTGVKRLSSNAAARAVSATAR